MSYVVKRSLLEKSFVFALGKRIKQSRESNLKLSFKKFVDTTGYSFEYLCNFAHILRLIDIHRNVLFIELKKMSNAFHNDREGSSHDDSEIIYCVKQRFLQFIKYFLQPKL